MALLFGIWQLANLNWLGPLGVAATRPVAPLELPLWQIAGAANAVLAWLFFFRADQTSIGCDNSSPARLKVASS